MAEGQGSAGIGGLYVAVGVEGDRAVRETKQLFNELTKVSLLIQQIGRNADFSTLTRKLQAANADIARTKKQIAATASGTGAPARDEAKVMQRQMEDAHKAAVIEDRRRQSMAIASAAQRTKLAQATAAREVDLAHKAALGIDRTRSRSELHQARSQIRAAVVAMRTSNREAAAAEAARAREVRAATMADAKEMRGNLRAAAVAEAARTREARAAEKAAAREIRAAQLAHRSRIGGIKRGGADFATAGAALSSGNPGYAVANVAQGLVKMSSALGGVSLAAAGTAAGIAAVVAVIALLEAAVVAITWKLAQFGIQTAASFETLQLQLEGLLGSARAGREEMDFLLDLGKQSIVPTESLIAADRQLAAFGVEVTSQRRQLIRFISDFGTATSATEQQIYFLSLAIGQVAARGKADMVDLKQLGNAGITTRSIYKGVAAEIGISWQKVRDGVKDGIITSDVLIAAITKMGGKYQDTAEKARKSTNGLLANIKDVITVGMGRAFAGLNKQFGALLQSVMGVVNMIDFTHIATAVQQFFGYITAAFNGVTQGGGDAAYFFNHTLPQAINVAGYALGTLIRVIRTWWEVLMIQYNTIQLVVQAAIWGFAKLGGAAASVLDFVGVIGDEEGEAWRQNFQQMANGAEAAMADAVEDAARSNKILLDIWSEAGYKTLYYTVTPLQAAIATGQVPKQAADPQPQWYLDMVAGWDAGNDPPKPPPAPQGSSSGGNATRTDPRIAKMRKLIDEWKRLIDTAIAGRQVLVDAFNIPFSPKLLEGGMAAEDIRELGAAFSAFTSGDFGTIVSKYKELRQAIADMYAPGMLKALGGKQFKALKAQRDADIAFLKAQTGELVRLAASDTAAQKAFDAAEKAHEAAIKIIDRERDELAKAYAARQRVVERQYDDYYTATSATEGRFYKGVITIATEAVDAATAAYEDAQAKLDDLIAARADFLSGLRDTAFDFVNDLSHVSEEITRYTRLDEFGSFSQVTTTDDTVSLASFKDGLRKRLDTLREWVANVRTLMSRGLSGDLLKSITTQGPEATSELAKALAGGADSEIAAINGIQSELAAEIGSLQAAASAQWFDAGIAAQQAYTAPLKAAMESAQAQVEALTQQRDLALGILAAWNADQEAMLNARQETEDANLEAAKDTLTATLEANKAAAETIAAAIDARLALLPTTAYSQGLATVQGMIDGLNDEAKYKELKAAARRLANAVAEAVADTLRIHSPSEVGYEQFRNYGLGGVLGLDSTVQLVEASAGRLANAAIAAMPVGGHGDLRSDTYIKVQIGDQELRDMIDAQVVAADEATGAYVLTGRRI